MRDKFTYSSEVDSDFDVEEASSLVQASFLNFIAQDWSESAIAEFLTDTSPIRLRTKITSSAYFGATYSDNALAGLILLTRPSFVQMLFVAPDRVRDGVGRYTWEKARVELEEKFPESKTIELNASPYSVPFYESLGFARLSEEYLFQGCRATRMACWLPAAQLAAELKSTAKRFTQVD
jgi:GNAT superfamily N-acetyltransferase